MSIFHLKSPITELAFDRKTPSMPRLFTVGTPHKVSSVVVFVHGHSALLMVCKSHLIWGIKSHGGGRTSAIHRARLLKLKNHVLGFPIGGMKREFDSIHMDRMKREIDSIR